MMTARRSKNVADGIIILQSSVLMVVRMYKTELQVASQITVLSTFSPSLDLTSFFGLQQ